MLRNLVGRGRVDKDSGERGEESESGELPKQAGGMVSGSTMMRKPGAGRRGTLTRLCPLGRKKDEGERERGGKWRKSGEDHTKGSWRRPGDKVKEP